jgi:anti-sigma-K factor RskA
LVQLAGVRGELAGVRSELADARTELAAMQQEIGQLQAQVAAAQRVLASLEGDGSGAILETRDGATVFVAQLPPLQPGRVYQLWRIQGDNPPASAGIFTVDAHGFGQTALPRDLQPHPGDIVAVTNEPDGGSPGPTSDPLISGQTTSA